MGYEAIIFILIFVGVILIVEGLYLVAFGKSISSSAKVNRRLSLLEEGKDYEEVLTTLRREREQHKNSLKFPIFSILSKKAAQANIAFTEYFHERILYNHSACLDCDWDGWCLLLAEW